MAQFAEGLPRGTNYTCVVVLERVLERLDRSRVAQITERHRGHGAHIRVLVSEGGQQERKDPLVANPSQCPDGRERRIVLLAAYRFSQGRDGAGIADVSQRRGGTRPDLGIGVFQAGDKQRDGGGVLAATERRDEERADEPVGVGQPNWEWPVEPTREQSYLRRITGLEKQNAELLKQNAGLAAQVAKMTEAVARLSNPC